MLFFFVGAFVWRPETFHSLHCKCTVDKLFVSFSITFRFDKKKTDKIGVESRSQCHSTRCERTMIKYAIFVVCIRGHFLLTRIPDEIARMKMVCNFRFKLMPVRAKLSDGVWIYSYFRVVFFFCLCVRSWLGGCCNQSSSPLASPPQPPQCTFSFQNVHIKKNIAAELCVCSC